MIVWTSIVAGGLLLSMLGIVLIFISKPPTVELVEATKAAASLFCPALPDPLPGDPLFDFATVEAQTGTADLETRNFVRFRQAIHAGDGRLKHGGNVPDLQKLIGHDGDHFAAGWSIRSAGWTPSAFAIFWTDAELTQFPLSKCPIVPKERPVRKERSI